NIAGLKDDHARAAVLAEALADLSAGEVAQATNMVFFTPTHGTAALRAALAEQGVLIGGQSRRIRMVLHRDVDDAALAAAIEAFRGFYGE
ncbi:MAG: low-specificity L-threonine aldolase, partial [Albidovulum sp.]